jgi:GntR family transcriptional regulator, galactonate operon transcriptional repressor
MAERSAGTAMVGATSSAAGENATFERLQPARGVRLGPAIVVALVDDIVGGVYPPGSTLPTESDLCDRFNVSRTVVRESVKLLQDKGLVRIVRGKGTEISYPVSWDMIDDIVLTSLVDHDETLGILDDLIAVRAALEEEMAGLAATAATGEQLRAINDSMRRMREVAGVVSDFAIADVQFHDLVMEASGNRLGRAIVSSIHGKARTTGRYNGAATPENIAQTLTEHQRILDALNNHDAGTAHDCMRAHITDSWARRRPSAGNQSTGG